MSSKRAYIAVTVTTCVGLLFIAAQFFIPFWLRAKWTRDDDMSVVTTSGLYFGCEENKSQGKGDCSWVDDAHIEGIVPIVFIDVQQLV